MANPFDDAMRECHAGYRDHRKSGESDYGDGNRGAAMNATARPEIIGNHQQWIYEIDRDGGRQADRGGERPAVDGRPENGNRSEHHQALVRNGIPAHEYPPAGQTQEESELFDVTYENQFPRQPGAVAANGVEDGEYSEDRHQRWEDHAEYTERAVPPHSPNRYQQIL